MTKFITRRDTLSRTEAEPLLQPYIASMRDWLHEAWDWVQSKLNDDPDLRKTCDLSIQAALVYNQFVERLQSGLSFDSDVHVDVHGRMVTVLIGGLIRLRFKKFDRDLRSGNVRTNRQREFYYQLLLPGMLDRMTDVTFGYCTSATATEITGVYITCPVGWRKNKWFIPIEDAASGGLTLYGPSTPAPDEMLPVVTPKIAPHKRKAE